MINHAAKLFIGPLSTISINVNLVIVNNVLDNVL